MSDSFNFANVSALEVRADEVRSISLPEIDGCPTLHGVCAGDMNQAFKKARLALNAKTRGKATGKLSIEQLREQARVSARELFPGAVITGWDDVYNAAGDAVEFSVEACAAYLRALPGWLLDRVIEFFVDHSNFAGEFTREEVDETAGN